jgi:hypothetical protein
MLIPFVHSLKIMKFYLEISLEFLFSVKMKTVVFWRALRPLMRFCVAYLCKP